MTTTFKTYHGLLDRALQGIEVTFDTKPLEIDSAIRVIHSHMRNCVAQGGTVWFIGNGGSSAMASHFALDFSKAKNIRAMDLNSPIALTAISNDISFHEVFVKQIEMYCRENDILVAISSSGESLNIIDAVRRAISKKMFVITLSGFKRDNNLQHRGNCNFYVPSKQYGFVECSHNVILHAILDLME